MAFDFLLNKSNCEFILMDSIARELRKNYSFYQDSCFFIRLQKTEPFRSKIVDVQTFSDIRGLEKYHFNTEYERACILLKFYEGKYEMLCFGNFIGTSCEVFEDKYCFGGTYFTSNSEREKRPMTSIETIRRLFDGFEEEFTSYVRKKSV